MAQIRDEVSAQGKSFGINVIDVRIRRADLPEENSQAIFARMKSEREQQAAQYRGEGAEAAQTVRANAERERTVLLADAQRQAQKVRGDGDAESIKVYAGAFGQDKEFFAFLPLDAGLSRRAERAHHLLCADAGLRLLPISSRSRKRVGRRQRAAGGDGGFAMSRASRPRDGRSAS